jgi:subtilisin family serine protease
MPLKIIDSTITLDFNIEDLASAIKYATDNGADVISISLENYADNRNLESAVNYAYGKGVVLVTAAGNFNTSNEHYPASYEKVIAAGGTNHNDNRMNFFLESFDMWIISNYGSWLDVAAPGYYIYTTLPSYHVTYNDYGIEQNYDYGGGTSAACPIIAGIAALLLSQDPTLTNAELKKIIRANVDSYESEYYIGTGRINAYKALTRYNSQPEIPDKPTGEIGGRTGRKYTFTTSSTDTDDDPLYYVWDWGDGNYSEEIGPFNSGETCEATYSWDYDGDYSITVKAVDGKGGESYWSESIVVSMPKKKSMSVYNPWICRLIERFPILDLLL